VAVLALFVFAFFHDPSDQVRMEYAVANGCVAGWNLVLILYETHAHPWKFGVLWGAVWVAFALCNIQAAGRVFPLTSAAVAFSGRAVALGLKRVAK
jgi:hypothetical protein